MESHHEISFSFQPLFLFSLFNFLPNRNVRRKEGKYVSRSKHFPASSDFHERTPAVPNRFLLSLSPSLVEVIAKRQTFCDCFGLRLVLCLSSLLLSDGGFRLSESGPFPPPPLPPLFLSSFSPSLSRSRIRSCQTNE